MFNNQIIAGSSGQGGGFYDYTINESLRFNAAESAYLSRTPSSTSNQKTWTFNTWIKLGNMPVASGAFRTAGIFAAGGGVFNKRVEIQFYVTDGFYIIIDERLDGGTYYIVEGTDSFRDVSGWYMFTTIVDTTESTAADRIRLYVNGTRLTNITNTNGYPAQNSDLYVNTSGLAHYIGETHHNTADYRLDAYLAEVNFVDGTAAEPSNFGETKNGIWVPKAYSGSYGTNGFYLSFADSSAIGDDLSGNTNDWTANNLAAHDVVPDSPTNNFPTLNPLDQNTGTLSEGNLKVVTVSTSSTPNTRATFAVNSGKWYWEYRIGDSQPHHFIGIVKSNKYGSIADDYITLGGNGANIYVDGSVSQSSLTPNFANGKVIGMALDADAETLQFYLDGTAHGTAESYASFMSGEYVAPWFIDGASSIVCTGIANFGQDSTFAGATTAGGNADANGIGDFKYAPPSGFLALCSANLPEPAIGPNSATQADDHFNTVLYTGNGTGQSITTGHASDFVWLKTRALAYQHSLYDSVRGGQYRSASDQALPEVDNSSANLQSFDNNGFTVGTLINDNQNAATYVGWSWKAGGTAVSNTDGTITSSVSANQDAGISILTYTGTGSNATVGHGLSQTPEWVVTKSRDSSLSWYVYVPGRMSTNKVLAYNATNAEFSSAGAFIEGDFNATTFGVGTETPTNKSGDAFLAHCFHSVEGYSKVGSFVGNNNADGPFIYTGFRPAFILLKSVNAARNWHILDAARNPYNVSNLFLNPNDATAEVTFTFGDFLSNGVKITNTGGTFNANGETYVYLAFAEAPFKYANAR